MSSTSRPGGRRRSRARGGRSPSSAPPRGPRPRPPPRRGGAPPPPPPPAPPGGPRGRASLRLLHDPADDLDLGLLLARDLRPHFDDVAHGTAGRRARERDLDRPLPRLLRVAGGLRLDDAEPGRDGHLAEVVEKP